MPSFLKEVSSECETEDFLNSFKIPPPRHAEGYSLCKGSQQQIILYTTSETLWT